MRKLVVGMWVAALFAGTAAGQDTPRAIVERAIRAHGGMDRLRRNRADRVKLKGSLYVGNKTFPFTGEVTVQLPRQLKSVMQVRVENRTQNVIRLLNGDKTRTTVNGQPLKADPALDNELRETLQLDRAVRLVPLLTDRAFTLALQGESKVSDRMAVGVKVTARGSKELRLYFDKETGLLIKTEHTWKDRASGKEVRQEEFYSDFRDLSGFRRPVKTAVYRDGKRIMEAELVEVKYFDKIDPTEFAVP